MNNMQLITIELKGEKSLKALQELEQKDLIRIVNEPVINSYCFNGEPLSNEDFKKWSEYAENSPTVGLTEAKQRWADQKKKLQKTIR